MESNDYYPGTYRSNDGVQFTKDGEWTWSGARDDTLYLQSSFPILDAAYSLAIAELLDYVAPAGTTSDMLDGGSPGSTYYYPYYFLSHGSDIREYTRDTSQHTEWGDSVIVDPYISKGTLWRRMHFENNSIREDAVVTADSLHIIRAIWTYFKITGDTNLLADTWNCLWNTINTKEVASLDSEGLWFGSPWSDNKSGFMDDAHFNERNTSVKSLYANTMAAGAWQALGNIASVLGKSGEAATCNTKYNALKTAINNHLYRPEFGTYCYYKYEPTNTYYDYREDISAGMVYLYGIADASRTITYHNRFVKTDYGYRNVDPVTHYGEASYHGGNVWSNEEGFHAWAMAELKNPDVVRDMLFWQARGGLITKLYREGTINPSTGELHNNYAHTVFDCMTYPSVWSRGVFGIRYETNGIYFDPCVPVSFGNDFYAVLNNFTYRNSTLRIILVGAGTNLDHITLDGAIVSSIPTDLSGSHEVKLFMSGNSNPVIPRPRARVTRYEAEAGETNAAIGSKVAASAGRYVGGMDLAGTFVSIPVNVPAAGDYEIGIGYANGKEGTAYRSLYINNSHVLDVDFPVTEGWSSFTERDPITVNLNAGSNTVKIQTDSGDAYTIDLDYIDVVDPNPTSTPTPVGFLQYEAENYASQSGCIIASNHAGYSGTGFLDYGGNATWAEWNKVYCSVTGTKTMTFTYANGSSGNRQCAITVNGNAAGNVGFTPTGGWTIWTKVTINVPMNSGNNTVRVTANTASGGPNLDGFKVDPATVFTPTPTATLTATPTAIPTATPTDTPTSSDEVDITDLGGSISAQYYDSPANEEIDKLIDNNVNTKYLTFNASGWVQYAGVSAVVTSYTITSANDAAERDPYSWTLSGSNDGAAWFTLDNRGSEDFPNRFETRSFSFANSTSYSWYRLNMNNNSGTILQLAEWELFGTTGGSTPVRGLNYQYYEGAWDVLPSFTTLSPVKTGTVSNFDLSERNTDDNFGFRFTGFINITTAGTYTFYTTSDDGSKLYINTQEIVNNDGLHGAAEQSGSINMTTGMKTIEVTFFELGGDQVLEVRYEGPGIARQLIPGAVLYLNP
ncbi:MAG: carbohydrate-binding protein [Spirochaetales bacterium]|nr:carbohydrate-binding protein [Spirochaetales bacterium]